MSDLGTMDTIVVDVTKNFLTFIHWNDIFNLFMKIQFNTIVISAKKVF